MQMPQTRRRFLTTVSLAGTVGILRVPPALAAEGALETTSVRFAKPGLCAAPIYVAKELLHTEGFTEIRYVDVASDAETLGAIGHGEADFGINFAPSFVRAIDAGEPIAQLGGVMVGCVELFAKESIRSVSDLRGKSVGLEALGTTQHALLGLMAAHVGLDPAKDIHWLAHPSDKQIELFVDGKIDALLSSPPESQDLRARHVGHVIVNTAVDRPWSQYFCCMLGGNREFVQKHPVATKRVLRAVLKATDLCATQPTRAAQELVDGAFNFLGVGGAPRYASALQTLSENSYDKWREYDPEDTIRFYALRLHEVGFIKSSPQKIIANGTDWRFLNDLKRELKA
jgi:NitT/TauT family transport system substrate-binding protein